MAKAKIGTMLPILAARLLPRLLLTVLLNCKIFLLYTGYIQAIGGAVGAFAVALVSMPRTFHPLLAPNFFSKALHHAVCTYSKPTFCTFIQ